MGILSVNLIILILIIILMKMILILLLLSDLWLSIVNSENLKHLKKDKWRINTKSVECWNLLKNYFLLSNAFNASAVYNIELLEPFLVENYAQRLDIVQKPLWISCHFDTKNYAWRFDIVQNFSCMILWDILSQNIY